MYSKGGGERGHRKGQRKKDASGIYLILAVQRADANGIPGQIKNNLDSRMCGRATAIILDNTIAAGGIPKDARGRFILQEGTVFRGYLFNEGQL